MTKLDFDKFRTLLNDYNWETTIRDEDIETSVHDISKVILDAAKQSIPQQNCDHTTQ